MPYGNRQNSPLILLNVGRIEMNVNWNYTNQCSPFLRIYYIESGEAWLTIKHTEYHQQPGKLYIVPPFICHGHRYQGRLVQHYAHILDQSIHEFNIYEKNNFPIEVDADEEVLRFFQRLEALSPHCSLTQLRPAAYNNTQSIKEAISRFNRFEPNKQYEMQALTMMLIAKFYSRSNTFEASHDKRLCCAQRYIMDNLGKPLPLEELAEKASVCKDSLIRLFKRELGVTPVNYILKKRIEKAQTWLATQDLSINDIAVQLGFVNQSYFSAQFKKAVGISPLQYRKQNQIMG